MLLASLQCQYNRHKHKLKRKVGGALDSISSILGVELVPHPSISQMKTHLSVPPIQLISWIAFPIFPSLPGLQLKSYGELNSRSQSKTPSPLTSATKNPISNFLYNLIGFGPVKQAQINLDDTQQPMFSFGLGLVREAQVNLDDEQ